MGMGVGRLSSVDDTLPGGSKVLSGMGGAVCCADTGEIVEGAACCGAVGGVMARDCWSVWISESCDMSFWR